MILTETSVLLTTAYLGSISYFQQIAHNKAIYIEQYDHYIKQTYRNRCRIATSNQIMDLSIPLLRTGEKQITKDIKIAYSENWQQIHWRAIESAYNASPFFEYYRDDFEPFYKKKTEFLIDFNQSLLEIVVPLVGLKSDIQLTESYVAQTDCNIKDLRDSFSPKKEYEGDLKPYYQVFEQKFGFQKDLSIIDLLFNMGPESFFVL